MCVTSGGGVKLSAYVGIHIVICGFRAFACAFCTAFNKSLILNFLLSAESSLQRTSQLHRCICVVRRQSESLPIKFPVFYFRCPLIKIKSRKSLKTKTFGIACGAPKGI